MGHRGRIFVYDEKAGEVVEVTGQKTKVMKHSAFSKPAPSIGSGVHSSQIPESRTLDKQLGVHAEYDSVGRPQFTSLRHQAKYLKSRGMFNRDGTFS